VGLAFWGERKSKKEHSSAWRGNSPGGMDEGWNVEETVRGSKTGRKKAERGVSRSVKILGENAREEAPG